MAMEVTAATATPAADVGPRRSPDSAATKPLGFLAYANGALKRHYPTAPTPPPEVCYKECMRNHAANIGGHALDGCCEFMPSPSFTPSDPTSLRCAACGCHRNFHRRDPDDPAPLQLHHRRHPKLPFTRPPPKSPPSPPTPTASPFFPSAPHMLMALKNPTAAALNNSSGGGGKKRFRTKFTQEQKEKMYEFSEKLGWKLQKIEKGVVDRFCEEIGVGKEVLKVWMHNNKNTLGRKEHINGSPHKNGDGGGEEEKNVVNGGEAHNHGSLFEDVHLVSADGSSSSG